MKWLVVSVLMLMASSLSAQQGAVKSELSASSITLDESVTLSIIAIGVEGELDTSALNEDFDIVGSSSSRQVSSISGSNSQLTSRSVITWALELMPRKAGVFTVPAVKVGGVSSELLTLTVNEIPASARRDVFVEATVDTRTPWVQSQVLLSIRVFLGIEIVDGDLSEPAGKDIQVQRIGKRVQTTEERDGRRYSVTEIRYALFPQKSGALEIDPIVLSVSVPANNGQRSIFSTMRKLTRRSDSLTLEVQARPSSGTAWWLPASELMLTSSWAGGKADARVGQPLTRTVTMRGLGILDSQLPDISIPAVDGVSLYAEEPVKSMVANERGLQAEQTIKWALIPQREGELVLPEVSVEWFNTDTGKTETALLPEEIVSVAAAVDSGSASSTVAPPETATPQSITSSDESSASLPPLAGDAVTDLPDMTIAGITPEQSASGSDQTAREGGGDAGSAAAITSGESGRSLSGTGADALQAQIVSLQSATHRWKLIALILLALWVLSVAIFWWRKKRSIVRERVAGKRLGAVRKRANAAYQTLAPLAAVEAACKGSDPAAMRGALLEWAARQWPEHAPTTLTGLASRFDEGPVYELIQALDACLYSRHKDSPVHPDLLSRLQALPSSIASTAAGRKQSLLLNKKPRPQGSSNKDEHGLPEL